MNWTETPQIEQEILFAGNAIFEPKYKGGQREPLILSVKLAFLEKDCRRKLDQAQYADLAKATVSIYNGIDFLISPFICGYLNLKWYYQFLKQPF